MKTLEEMAEAYAKLVAKDWMPNGTKELKNYFIGITIPNEDGSFSYCKNIFTGPDIRPAFVAGYEAAKNQLADASKVMNSSKKPDGWISVKERLPTAADGVTQLWMRGCSLTELVLGCHAVMFEHNEKIEGVLDMNKPDGIWDLSDFTHWMPLPEPPEKI